MRRGLCLASSDLDAVFGVVDVEDLRIIKSIYKNKNAEKTHLLVCQSRILV